jgi:hypothetical protein
MLCSLPLASWPELTGRLGVSPASRGSAAPGRPGGSLKAVTRQDLERRYGYYLTHLAETGQLDLAAPAGSAGAACSGGGLC